MTQALVHRLGYRDALPRGWFTWLPGDGIVLLFDPHERGFQRGMAAAWAARRSP